jgi:selenocysteine-specific elongation factor
MTVVIGTAGHIDHGKTALLRALTGIDADRLPEERRRGMTIDVGYAHLRLPDGADLDFVDVPGHDRLVGNMLVGAGEIDAVLLVVAADDGPRAQTLEHLALLDGLGIAQGLIALTKTDAVEPGRLTEVEGLIRAMLRGTSLEGSPVVPVSSIDRRGLPELLIALGDLRDRVQARSAGRRADDPVRLSIDRSFVIKGRGAVVTGSLRGGRLERGALLRLVPGDRLVRAREVQVHGGAVDALEDGGRVAINLAAIEAGDLPRGAVLTTDPGVQASAALIAIVRSNPAAAGPGGLEKGATFRLHLGTEQVQATVGRGRADLVSLPDGGVGGQVARLRLARPIAVATGDRFVLRRGGTSGAVIGGQVLDPDPPVGPSRRRADAGKLTALAAAGPLERAQALVALHGVIDPGRLAFLPGAADDADDAGDAAGADSLGALALAGMLVAGPIAAALDAEAIEAVAGRAGSVSAAGLSLAELRTRLLRVLRRLATVDERHAGGIVDALLAGLVGAGRLERVADRIHVPGRSAELPVGLVAAMDRLERSLALPAPPSLAEAVRTSGCSPDGVRALESAGRIIRLDGDLAYAAATYRELADAALRMARTGALAPAAYRDATGTSRKYVLAILEDLDRRGILRRSRAGHLPGPRAAAVDEIGRTGR